MRWPVLLPLVWQGEQNKGMMVNHLETMHYHLGLICIHCMDYFTTSTGTMHQHAQVCKPMTGSDIDDDREEGDYEDDDNGDEDDEFVFEED